MAMRIMPRKVCKCMEYICKCILYAYMYMAEDHGSSDGEDSVTKGIYIYIHTYINR
jgi:hypothetical protein